MDPSTNAIAISRREVLCASGAAALSALVAGVAGCAATTSPPSAVSADPSKAQITVLYDAFGKASAMQKDWGYAALIDYGGKRILFDTGNNPDILALNAKAKDVDLSRLDFVVMSHRHGDHMGGIAYLLSVNPKVKIYAPKEGFGVYGADLPSTFYRKDASLPPEQRYYDGAPPAVMRFGAAWPGANFQLIDKNTEIVVGCSHPGIDKIVETATAINPRIHFVVGGFHLVVSNDADIEKIVTALRDRFKVAYIAPGHCTGEPTFTALNKAFTDRYLYAGLGTTFALGATPRSTASAARNDLTSLDEDDRKSYRTLFATSDDHGHIRLGHATNCCGRS